MVDHENARSVSAATGVSEQKGAEADGFEVSVVDQIRVSQVARESSYNRRNIASDVLIAAGRHPTMPGLNSDFSILRRTLPSIFDSPVDLATVRWDILDPAHAPAIDAETGDKGSTTTPTVRRLASLGSGEIAAATPTDPQQVGGGVKGREETGFPATTPTEQPPQTVPKTFYLALSQSLSHSVPGAPSTLPKEKMEEARAPKRPIKSVIDHVAMPNKKATPSNRARLAPSGNIGKRASRAKEVTPNPAKQQERSPLSDGPSGYKIYPCEWLDCPAELHNYETLVRHVMFKHQKAGDDGTFKCQWAGCFMGPAGDTASENIQHQYPGEKEWAEHVMTHMEQVKEVLGLGPRLSDSDYQPVTIDFMSDINGHPVTPLAIVAPPGYPFTPPPGYMADAAFRKAHGIKYQRPSRAAKIYAAEMERAEKIGAGIEDVVEPPGWDCWQTDYSREIEEPGEDQGGGDNIKEEGEQKAEE